MEVGWAVTAARQDSTPDYSVAVLSGDGANDYVRYMRTDALLALQRVPEEMVHRDELLFQTVHQSTELWLKHACFELHEATRLVGAGCLDEAARLIARASLGMELITGQLEMMTHLSPWAFQTIRPALGHGSGLESPGWRSMRRAGKALGAAFTGRIAELGVDLVELYRQGLDTPLYRLAEAMVECDERIALWRTRHYKVAIRVIGHRTPGTKGTPADALVGLIDHKFFPELWGVRTALADAGPLGATR